MTGGYRRLQRDTGELQEVAGGYKRLQRVTKDYKGL